MGNLTANDHNGYERAVLNDRSYIRRTNGAGQKLLSAYTVLAVGLLAALTYTAVLIFDGWQHALVIGVGLVTFYGLARWVWPERSRVY
jgi:hypothetical protein